MTAGGRAATASALRVGLVAQQLRRPVPGGVGTYTRGLLLGLAALGAGRGVAVELLASRAGRSRPAAPPGRHDDPLRCFGLPLRLSPLPGTLLTAAWDLGVLGARGRFDVLHASSLAFPRPRGGTAGGRASLVVTVHDLAWRQHPEATTWRGRHWHEAALGRALRRATAFVVPSEPVAAELIGAGASPGAVSVVPEGCDHLPEPDHEAAAALLGRHGVRGGYLLTVGTLEPRKNLGRLVAAYELARPALDEPWPLVVVGPRGWGDAGVGRGVAGPAGVAVVGPVPDGVLAGLYASARAFAYVPLAEGFGLPPLEAMSFGVPVVTSTAVPSVTPAPGAPAAALRVAPDAVEAIAEALVQACTDPATRARLGQAGKELAATRSWRQAAAGHVALWESLA